MSSNSKNSREIYQKRKEEKRCTYCGKQNDALPLLKCKGCSDKISLRGKTKKWWLSKK